MFRMLYYRDIVTSIRFLLPQCPFWAHLDFEPVRLADHDGHQIDIEMISGDCWWNTQKYFPDTPMIVPVICAYDTVHLTICFRISARLGVVYHDWYYSKRDPPDTKIHPSLPIELIACHLRGGTYLNEAWHTVVGTVLSQLRHHDITGPGLKWNCADVFEGQCYPLLAAWVGNYP